MIAGRVAPELKELFAEEAEQRGISQQELLEEAVMQLVSSDVPESTEVSSQPLENLPLDELDAADLPGVQQDEEIPEETLQVNVMELFPPLLASEINCAIIESAKNSNMESAPVPLADLLLEFADNIDEEAIKPRKYNCQNIPYQDILSEDATLEIEQILRDAKNELKDTSDKETIFKVIAQFSYQRSDELYEEGRAIKLKFTRSEWKALDKVVKQANTERKASNKINLEELIRLKLGEIMEELGRGFWGAKDKLLYELGQEFQQFKNH